MAWHEMTLMDVITSLDAMITDRLLVHWPAIAKHGRGAVGSIATGTGAHLHIRRHMCGWQSAPEAVSEAWSNCGALARLEIGAFLSALAAEKVQCLDLYFTLGGQQLTTHLADGGGNRYHVVIDVGCPAHIEGVPYPAVAGDAANYLVGSGLDPWQSAGTNLSCVLRRFFEVPQQDLEQDEAAGPAEALRRRIDLGEEPDAI